MIDKPKIRPVEAFPVEISNRKMLALRDPVKIATDTIFISDELLFILQLFNGINSCAEIQTHYSRQFNQPLDRQQLNRIIQNLDEKLFLDSDNFQLHQAKLVAEFRQLDIRPPALADQSYPKQPEELKNKLTGFFNSINHHDHEFKDQHIKALIAPHIDIQAGGETFAHAYNSLTSALPIELFIIFGTGHNGISHSFSCTDKDFETPLGIVKTDKSFLKQLQDRVGFDIYAEEILHKNEHTIEFQTIFLQHLFGRTSNWQIVPILCSFGPQLVQPDRPENYMIQNFLNALRQLIRESGKRTCVIASADLAHIGLRYGDTFSPTEDDIQSLRNKDLKTLKFAEQLDISQFVASVSEDENQRRICGFPPIYSTLKVIEATKGKLLHYDCVSVDQSNSIVSFASMTII